MGDFRPDRRERAPRREGARRAGRRGPPAACASSSSGGFTVDRIAQFEAEGVPVDAYGVGSSLIRGDNDFTADVVQVNGRPVAKVGRGLKPNARLEIVS